VSTPHHYTPYGYEGPSATDIAVQSAEPRGPGVVALVGPGGAPIPGPMGAPMVPYPEGPRITSDEEITKVCLDHTILVVVLIWFGVVQRVAFANSELEIYGKEVRCAPSGGRLSLTL